MNIGDKVRFLNAVGGGKITAFQGKDIVLVCDEDGFEIPTLRSEIVVIDTNDYNFARPTSNKASKASPNAATDTETPTSIKALLSQHANKRYTDAEDQPLDVEEEAPDLADLELRFQARPVERRGGDLLNLALGFVPLDDRKLTTTQFEAYLINDSNYTLRYALLTQDGTTYRLLHEGEIPANTKLLLDRYTHAALSELERLTCNVFAFKREKAFALKAPVQLTLRIDVTKFYKLHTFHPSDFFNQPALIYPLLTDDQPATTQHITAQQIEEALTTPQSATPNVQPARTASPASTLNFTTNREGLIEIDLHANKLLEQTEGLSSRDILMCQIKRFHEVMRAHRKAYGCRIVFIHGKGNGVLRVEIIKELKRYYPRCTHQDASFREYSFGATLITILR